MNLLDLSLRSLVAAFRPAPKPHPPITVPKPKQPTSRFIGAAMRSVIARMLPTVKGDSVQRMRELLGPAQPPPGVVPSKDLKRVLKLASDSIPYGWAGACTYGGVDNYFKGYPYLAQLAQMPEYRSICQTIAEEMTRKGIKLTSDDDADEDLLSKLTECCKRYNLMPTCLQALELDCEFGRSHIYIDIKAPGGTRAFDDKQELEKELFLAPSKIKKGSLIGFTVVEAMWAYPGVYNSTNPLDDNYYRPETWYVMGNVVHESRLMLVCAQPVPDLFKAAYSFGGISLIQMAEPYVDNWIRTRNSVGDMVHMYSTSGLKTNLSALLEGQIGEEDPSNIFTRLELFSTMRDNKGIMLVDKNTEELFQINTPLSGLHELQAQAQEHICSITHIPLVKYTGLAPTGLNASSDGEIRVWYDFIRGRQERVLRPLIKHMLEVIQLSEIGVIDESITFEFVSLFEPTPKELEELRKSRAETDKTYVDSGVFSQEEIRGIAVNESESRYASIDDALPEELKETDKSAEEAVVEASGRASGEA